MTNASPPRLYGQPPLAFSTMLPPRTPARTQLTHRQPAPMPLTRSGVSVSPASLAPGATADALPLGGVLSGLTYNSQLFAMRRFARNGRGRGIQRLRSITDRQTDPFHRVPSDRPQFARTHVEVRGQRADRTRPSAATGRRCARLRPGKESVANGRLLAIHRCKDAHGHRPVARHTYRERAGAPSRWKKRLAKRVVLRQLHDHGRRSARFEPGCRQRVPPHGKHRPVDACGSAGGAGMDLGHAKPESQHDEKPRKSAQPNPTCQPELKESRPTKVSG